jgi:hypothetical protein
MKELEGYIPVTIGVKKLFRSLTTLERDRQIKDGLIKKKKNISGKKDSGAHLARGRARKEGFSA